MEGLSKNKKIKLIAIILALSFVFIIIGVATGNSCSANRNKKVENYTKYTFNTKDGDSLTAEYESGYAGTLLFYVNGARIVNIQEKNSYSSSSATYSVYDTNVNYNGVFYDYCYKVKITNSYGNYLISFSVYSSSMILYISK